MKLVAMGNVLMGDDGIALYLTSMLEDKLRELGIAVIFGETDIGYCLTQLEEEDFVILIDAAELGKKPGELTLLSFEELAPCRKINTSHCISFFDLLKLYYPKMKGVAIMIQIYRIDFHYGLSDTLKEKTEDMLNLILEQIRKIKYIVELE